jgi:hypothetical protein
MSDDDRNTTKNLRVTEAVHGRLKAHTREGETLSGTINRALDALDREAELPRVVTEALADADSDTRSEA